MQEIRKVLKKLEYGVYLVTTGKSHTGNALTASWVMQVSSEPKMVAIAVKSSHKSTAIIEEHGAFVVNLLKEEWTDVAKIYYGPAESGYEKLKHAFIEDSPATGTPIFEGVPGYLDCKVVNTIEAGNHTIFIGEVKAAKLNDDIPILTTTNSKLHYEG
jgi:flavin reductase (DIM6/NTAB) family NADH-FMN oxidoreductase RutF